MKENEGIGESGFSCNSSPCPTKRTRISWFPCYIQLIITYFYHILSFYPLQSW